MAPMPLPELQQRQLLAVALASIRHGLTQGQPLSPQPEDYPPALSIQAATFVTLHHNQALRGCIGHLQPLTSLVEDIANNAYAAAFEDPRFGPLQARELQGLNIHIAVLGPIETLQASSEQALIKQLRPGIDGLILEEGAHRATFLPSVWEQLPEPGDFIRALKRKAGMAQNHWSEAMRASRYQTQSFGDSLGNIETSQSGLSL